MSDASSENVARACRKLIEFRDLLRQNFSPAPEMMGVFNECIDLLIDAGLEAEHYKVGKDIKALEFRERLDGVIEDFCRASRPRKRPGVSR